MRERVLQLGYGLSWTALLLPFVTNRALDQRCQEEENGGLLTLVFQGRCRLAAEETRSSLRSGLNTHDRHYVLQSNLLHDGHALGVWILHITTLC